MVDADGHARDGNCNAGAAAYSTIQAAISAAHAGDTVKVCPGDYTENVVIGSGKDNLSIVSVESFQAHIWRSTDLTGNTPLVEIRPGADGVLFKHFTLLFPTSNDCDMSTYAAIEVGGPPTPPFRANRIKTDGPDAGFATCGYAVGVNVGPAEVLLATASKTRAAAPAGLEAPASALVGWNIVRDYQFIGIGVFGRETTATTKRNSIHFGHQGATDCLSPVTSTAGFSSSWRGVAAARNQVSPSGPGPLFCFALGMSYSDGASGEITSNVIESDVEPTPVTAGSPTPASGPLSFYAIANGISGSAGTVTISRNHVKFSFFGIGVETQTTQVISDNNVRFTVLDGIAIEGGSGVKVRHNKTQYSNGYFASDESGGNIFKENVAVGGECDDESEGTDTGGTANHWVGNVADSSSPAGICTPAP